MKWVLRIAVAAIVAFALWRTYQWLFVTDEMRIQRQISVMASAVEKADLVRLSNALASDYSDDWGLDKSTLLGAVHPDHQKAQAVFIAKIIAKARGSVSDSEAREDRFRLYFRKSDSVWELIRTESPELKFD
jgi:hypothetical protein